MSSSQRNVTPVPGVSRDVSSVTAAEDGDEDATAPGGSDVEHAVAAVATGSDLQIAAPAAKRQRVVGRSRLHLTATAHSGLGASHPHAAPPQAGLAGSGGSGGGHCYGSLRQLVRQQLEMGPVRRWRRRQLPLPTLIGGGEVHMSRWVPGERPPPMPRQVVPVEPPRAQLSAAVPLPGGGNNGAGAARPVPMDAPAASSSSAAAAAAAGAAHHLMLQMRSQPRGGSPSLGGAPAAGGGGHESAPGGGDVIAGVRQLLGAAAAAAAGAGGNELASDAPVCPHCDKVFATLGGLRKHMHVHGEATHHCDFPGCGKSFVDAGKLARHQLSHATARDFICPVCGRAFLTDWNLRKHWRAAHKDLPIPNGLYVETGMHNRRVGAGAPGGTADDGGAGPKAAAAAAGSMVAGATAAVVGAEAAVGSAGGGAAAGADGGAALARLPSAERQQ